MGTTAQKLEYLGTTKSQLKDQINYGLPTEKQITNQTTFREYVGSIFEAFLEALRNPDTLFTNLPKTSASGSQITLNGTANAPMRITLNPTAITQDGTPTPSSPQDIHTISGDNSVVVDNGNGVSQTAPINLGEYELGTIGNYSNEFVRSGGEQLFDIDKLKNSNPNASITGTYNNFTWYYENTWGYYNIDFEENTSYTFSGNWSTTYGNGVVRIYYTDNTTFDLINNYSLSNASGTISKTSDSNKTIDKIGFMTFSNGNWTLTNFQINKGTTALPYTPYEKGWYYKQGIGKVVLDGTESWNSASSVMSGTIRFYSEFSSIINGGNETTNTNIYVKSNNFKGTYWYDIYSTNTIDKNLISNYNSSNSLNRIVIRIDNTYASDVATFKTWLSNNNTIVYYVLATPTYTKITGELAQELESVNRGMLSYDGTTNISQVNNDLSFSLSVSAIEKLS